MRLRGAHLGGEIQAELIDVRDHDVARAAVARNRHRHDADGSRAGDEHVLADDVEGERRVRGVAERVEDRGDFVVDGGRELEDVGRGQGQILRERSGAVHADALRVAAKMPAPRAAVAAMSAGDVSLAGHPIAGLDAAHLAADLDDLARILVTDGHRHRNGLLRPRIPVVDVHVGAADGGAVHLDEHVVVTDRGLRHVLHPDAGFRASLDQCFHEPAF